MFFDKPITNDNFVVYLSGSIQKGHDKTKEQSAYWGKQEKLSLRKGASPLNLIELDPCERTHSLDDTIAILGRDILQVVISDAVIVDGREKRGIGVGAEIDRAETQNIPIIGVVPENTVYHKFNTSILGKEIDEWKHPFIFGYATYVGKSFEEAGIWLKDNLQAKKDILPNPISDRMLKAMQHYLSTCFEEDLPMKKAYEDHQVIHERIEKISKMNFVDEIISKNEEVNQLVNN